MRGVLHPTLSVPFLSAFWVLAPSIGGAIVEKALTCPPCFDYFEWHCIFFLIPFILQLPLPWGYL